MNKVEKMYELLVNSPSDINEHLPILKKYASECNHVTEMGVRWVVSSYAFAVSKPKTFIAIDITHPKFEEWDSAWNSSQRLLDIEEYCKENNINFNFVLGDTTKIEIEETDLLFIDTMHNYNQLKIELSLHSSKVKKYLIFHDTESFKFKNEIYSEEQQKAEKEGVWPAIEEFLEKNNDWKLHEVRTNCNGLTVLKRV